MKQITVFFLALLALLMMGGAAAQESPARVTILYDAFGKPSTLILKLVGPQFWHSTA